MFTNEVKGLDGIREKISQKQLNRFNPVKAARIMFFNHACDIAVMNEFGMGDEGKKWLEALGKGFAGVVQHEINRIKER